MNLENRNPPIYIVNGYVIPTYVYGLWSITHIYNHNDYNIWLGTVNNDNIWIIDGILTIYLLIGLYLCRLTITIWWGLLVLLVCISLTGLLGIMLYELVTIFMIWWLLMDSNTFERGGANSYIGWFSLTLGFMLISNFDLGIITVLVILIGLSKLPVYRLHQWLPKVHVEASLFRSMILAGIILKIGVIFIRLYGFSIPLVMVGLVSRVILMFGADRKVVIAYSSVIHMSLCRLLIGWMRLIVGASHIIISPLIFMAVYVGYINGRSRVLSPSFNSWMWRIILIVNLGFPLVGRFLSELYLIVWLRGMVLMSFMVQYTLMRLVHMRLFFKIKRNRKIEVKGWMILFLMLY